INAGVNPNFNCVLGNILFSNFTVIGNTNDPTPTVTVSFPLMSGPPETVFSFNPNEGSNFDVDLFFKAQALTGQITSVDLAVGGVLANVTERVCTAQIVGNPGNLCSPTGTQLAALAAESGFSTSATLGMPASTIYIAKDLGTQIGGGLSTVSESFTTEGEIPSVPEPMTSSLIGLGLVSLGLLRWRIKK
ncbi:MAG: PEP-CTERM sorting domain-containing protein, partial [Bryobacteraceae bacterium]